MKESRSFYPRAYIPHWPRITPRYVNFPKFLGLLEYLCQEDFPYLIREAWEKKLRDSQQSQLKDFSSKHKSCPTCPSLFYLDPPNELHWVKSILEAFTKETVHNLFESLKLKSWQNKLCLDLSCFLRLSCENHSWAVIFTSSPGDKNTMKCPGDCFGFKE